MGCAHHVCTVLLSAAVYYLDFKGRVREVSLKNFQLVHWDHNRNQLGTDLVLLFGKKEHSEYAVDFCYPMNALQAFALGRSLAVASSACIDSNLAWLWHGNGIARHVNVRC